MNVVIGKRSALMNAIEQAAAMMRANIPSEIQSLPRFCVWRMEPRVEGEEPTKIGRDPRTGRRAKSNDPGTWTTFDRAVNAFVHSAKAQEPFRGIFFALGDEYIGLDWDDCRDPETGAIAPAAADMITFFASYAEVSPSGAGVKMLIKGVMPTPDGRGKNFRPGTTWDDGLGPIEFYRRGRFFALTGQRVDGTPATINERSQKLAVLHGRLYPPKPVRPAVRVADIDNVDERARALRAEKYVARMPQSISGQRGHDRLLAAACACWRFGLCDTSALSILRDFNRRCDPPWPEFEIERKWREAAKVCGAADFGCMLRVNRNAALSPRRRVIYATSAEGI